MNLPSLEERYETRAQFYLARAYNVSTNKTTEQVFYIARRFLFLDLQDAERELMTADVTID